MDLSDTNHFVVFADMLGFAALVEANPIDVRMLLASGRPGSMGWDNILKPKNPLTEAFSSFHNHIKWEIMMAEMSDPVTAVTFSDSVFFATSNFVVAATFATRLTHSMLSTRVPVRVGIAHGSFAAVRFRSEISPESGDHAAQFLGTAVVRACQTEKCGIKGMRVLLHPSLEPLLGEAGASESISPSGNAGPHRFLKVASAELDNSIRVRYELNYWDLAAMKERKAWHSFQDMWTAAPAFTANHYQATAEAIDRMRVDQGELPLNNLRRRVVPRRPR